VADLPVKKHPEFDPAALALATSAATSAVRTVDSELVGMAYAAWLGFYNSNTRRLGMTRETLIATANAWAVETCGLREPPALPAKVSYYRC
jgi:ATP-dependent RNA helicase MSS116, mitochondrial